MSDELQTLDPVTKKPPVTRIKDAPSLNAIAKALIRDDSESALARVDVQKMLDGSPPYDEAYMRESGQEGRCNLNFGDGKARVKAEQAGYYDLTDSVPVLARLFTPYGDEAERSGWGNKISEEWHRMLKEWSGFHGTFQLLVQKFCSHGLGFLYHQDDSNWHWSVAGLEDFKVPRQASMIEDDLDIAIALREITVGKLYRWMDEAAPEDKRWNRGEVQKAILNAHDPNIKYSDGEWEKWQAMFKNNDLFASVSAKQSVGLIHAWVREFSGKVSQYITLRDATNTDYLFKCENRFDCIDQCFTYFPYEISTNGTLHATRGLAHEVYATVQVLNNLRCQTVDNAKLAGSIILQPKTETAAEDMAILFYAGAAYISPNVTIQNAKLDNPSTGILPVLQDMKMTMRQNTGDFLSKSSDQTNDKTKFEVQAELMKEAVLPTANLDLFYQPWGRHLQEVWRRTVRKGGRPWTAEEPGGQAVLDFFKRCKDRGVPREAIMAVDQVIPMRAIGYGSPTNRLLAFDEFMQYYGSLDPVGQNNLLRARFAQRVGYSEVNDYVPRIEAGGRAPVDQEIAELQNMAMGAGKPVSVRPNDNHIIHLQTHLPDMQQDLDLMESGQGTPQLLGGLQIKLQHAANHMKLLKPDKLQKATVMELTRVFNNTAERVQAAMDHADRLLQKQQAQQAQQPPQPSEKSQTMLADAATRRQIMIEDSQLKQRLREAEAAQKMSLRDATTAAKTRAEATRERFRNGIAVVPQPTPPIPAPPILPAAPAAPAAPPTPLAA